MNQYEHIQGMGRQAKANFRNESINESLLEFELLHGKLSDMLIVGDDDNNKIDRLTVELLKVVELKKIEKAISSLSFNL